MAVSIVCWGLTKGLGPLERSLGLTPGRFRVDPCTKYMAVSMNGCP